MSSPEFFQTLMGKRFFEGTMPRIAEALTDIAKTQKLNLKGILDERELLIQTIKDFVEAPNDADPLSNAEAVLERMKVPFKRYDA